MKDRAKEKKEMDSFAPMKKCSSLPLTYHSLIINGYSLKANRHSFSITSFEQRITGNDVGNALRDVVVGPAIVVSPNPLEPPRFLLIHLERI